jgi:hypothetical protein
MGRKRVVHRTSNSAPIWRRARLSAQRARALIGLRWLKHRAHKGVHGLIVPLRAASALGFMHRRTYASDMLLSLVEVGVTEGVTIQRMMGSVDGTSSGQWRVPI